MRKWMVISQQICKSFGKHNENGSNNSTYLSMYLQDKVYGEGKYPYRGTVEENVTTKNVISLGYPSVLFLQLGNFVTVIFLLIVIHFIVPT